jgi:geranylgeranyl diphosphate synthase, type II
METDFKQVLSSKKDLVWPEIEKYLNQVGQYPDYCAVSPKYQTLVELHIKVIADYPRRKGKYLRPALVLLTAQAMGFPEESAIRTAAAMQVSEDWILNHDDIEDDSLERRGQPCLHKLYGKELAINAGDGLHNLMWKILRDNEEIVGKEKTFEIIDEFYRMLNRTILGQTVEIQWRNDNRFDLTEEDVLFILESKTGYYSIGGPMRLGAILAGATEKQLSKLYEFGKLLGYCFQIKDDLLDLTSDFSGLKNQMGNDIYEGKRTVILVDLIRKLDPGSKKKLEDILRKTRDQKTKEEVAWVIEMMKIHGSLAYGEKLMNQFANQAKGFFNKNLDFLKNQPAREQIEEGIDFLIERES